MLSEVIWNGWLWNPVLRTADCASGILLDRLTRRIAEDVDLRTAALIIFGSSPWEFGLGLDVNSGDIDITPDQFYPIFPSAMTRWGFSKGEPHIQICPPGVFRPGSLWMRRAVSRKLNDIELILPHPMDIVAGKLHRFNEKDYHGITRLIESTGHPTQQDLRLYATENPDYFQLAPQEKITLINHYETLYSALGVGALDLQKEILNRADEQYREALDQVSLDKRLSRLDQSHIAQSNDTIK